MALAVYGKHPAKGDFLEYGLPTALKPAIEAWLDTALADAKASLGADWQAVWPAAQMLRFWLGEGIWGAPVAGVMAPSHDRVGRRFPLVLLALGDAGLTLPPPVIDPDQTWYDAACAHLKVQLLRHELSGPAALIAGAPQPSGADAPPEARDFWAARPGADVEGLLADIALTDHRRANEGRSYWWMAGTPAVADSGQPKVIDLEQVETVADTVSPLTDDADETESTDPAMPADPLSDDPTPDDPPSDDGHARHWDLPDTPETDASPFDMDDAVPSLFALPEPAVAVPEAAYVAPDTPTPAIDNPVWSQVWAGPGLPSGAVLAWFFRGHAGND